MFFKSNYTPFSLIKRNDIYFTDQQSNQGSKVEFSEEEEMLIKMVYNLVGDRLVDYKLYFLLPLFTFIPNFVIDLIIYEVPIKHNHSDAKLNTHKFENRIM